MSAKLGDVFGVSSNPVLSYIQRAAVDDRFTEALKADKQIIVYGSSKQGKTSLVQEYLPYANQIVVRLTPKTQIADIYASMLRQLGVELKSTSIEASGRETSGSVKAGFKALIPMLGSGGVSAETQSKAQAQTETTYKEVPFNLELPQDISELITETGIKKTIILENFHYLDDERQKQLSFDLRTFQELGIRFVILGVWREKNRLAQFNGDLVDRVIEIPVEPWLEEDFIRVADKGQKELNIEISGDLIKKCTDSSFSSIGVFQELLKEICIGAGVRSKELLNRRVDDLKLFDHAATQKASEYASRHQRALESMAAGNLSSSAKDGVQPLFLPYYLVRIILDGGYDGLANGMRRAVIQDSIQRIHHRPNDVRASDMSNLLHNLAALQAGKSISPPIIDYDKSTKLLQVVDSTFYFFLKNADLRSIADEIPNPLQ